MKSFSILVDTLPFISIVPQLLICYYLVPIYFLSGIDALPLAASSTKYNKLPNKPHIIVLHFLIIEDIIICMFQMIALVLLLPLLSWADSQLVSEPVPHLTPPHLEPLIRLPRNDSSASASSNEPLQQEARSLAWASPAVSLRDCNPCDSMPWVPMARSLQTPQYALSIPAIQLTLPVNYGIHMAPLSAPLKQHTAAHQPQGYSPPPSQHGPLRQYGTPSQVYQNYGPPPTGQGVGDGKGSAPPQNQYDPHGDETHGLPPPPLPQAFLSPTYGPPQPQTQFASSTNLNPTAASAIPHGPPPPQAHQLLPSVGFGPPFDPKLLNSNSPMNQPPPRNNMNQQLPPNGFRPLNQQYRDETGKRPTFLHNPIPFSTMSKSQLPPLFNYQTFNDGKQNHLHSYLQPPKPQNVVFTITETEDSCKKCQEQNQQKDSEPAQAEQVTDSIVKTSEPDKTNSEEHFRRPTEQFKKPLEQDKSNVQIVKSVPLAEYLSSVEYPMQIIQAPILDVPDLSKYFNLRYSNLPQVHNFQGNNFRFHPKTPYQQILTSGQYQNYNYPSTSGTSFEKSSTTSSLDDVKISDYQTTNSLPLNHKLNTNNDLANHQSTDNTFSQSTSYHTNPTTRPSQIYHVTKSRPSSQPEPSKQTTVSLPLSSTLGHYVTLKPVTSDKVTSTKPTPLLEPVHSSSQNHQSTIATGNGLNPSGPSNLRYHDNVGVREWAYARGSGNTPPRPFVSPTSPSHIARFSVRPTPATPKKAKHIHQIIVPYTTNKQTPPVVREPTNTLGWTAIPPTNQGRKVPTSFNFGDQFPSTTGSDQTNNYQHVFPSANAPSGPNFALTSSGPDNLKPRPIFPTNHGQPLNLPPQVINHILHLNQQNTLWPTGPEGLQQLLVTNLQGLLRGEEDSVDITRLQKNIDNWTAEGYKQSAPSVNFIPVTTIPQIFHSKKIPDDFFTSTEPTSANYSQSRFPQHNFDSDHEVAESQKHQIKVHPSSHSKGNERVEDTSESIESLLNSWSLFDTKVTTLPTPPTEVTTTPEPTGSEPTSKVWEKIQVSISPLTNEKVYVVTPMTVTDSEPEENSTLLSTRVERSYSSEKSGKVFESSAPEHS